MATNATLFEGGTVWTGGRDPAVRADHTALAVSDGRVVALGEDAIRWAADQSGADEKADIERVDLDGGFLLPSFGDGHAHPVFGGLEDDGPQIRPCRSVEEIVAEVRRFADEHPPGDDGGWITGASYDSSLAPEGLFDARWLDEAVPDRPVVLRSWDYHTVWCNTAALHAAGIDEHTPDPPLGEIPRRPDGQPLGTLREWGAVDLAMRVAPAPGVDQRVAALARATRRYAALGVTWIQDAWVEPGDVETFLAASRTGVLDTRLNLAWRAEPREWPGQLAAIREARAQVDALGDPHLTAHTVKFFADGVVENETAALLDPYVGDTHSHGMPVWEPAHLAEAVRDVVGAGLQPHIHAIGDAAVRAGLDAVESATGAADLRPVLAHIQLVDPADIPRFAALGIVANAEPLWAQLDDLMVLLTVPRLGPERSDRQYALASILATGAVLSFGSDWPVSAASPLLGMSVAMSRTNDAGEPAGGWLPGERLDAEQALVAYTAGVAHQALADRAGQPWGTLAPGAPADLVLLDRDPRAVARHDGPASVRGLSVRGTWLAGRRTHTA